MNDVVNIDCYLTDLSRIEEFRTVRAKFINPLKPPVSTGVQVERLINKNILLEVNVIAVINVNN